MDAFATKDTLTTRSRTVRRGCMKNGLDWNFCYFSRPRRFSLDLVGHGLGHHGNGRKKNLVGCQAARVEHTPLRRFLLFWLLDRFLGRLRRFRWLRFLVGFVFEGRNKHFGLQGFPQKQNCGQTRVRRNETKRLSWCDPCGAALTDFMSSSAHVSSHVALV
jgi:hypothetical protein